MSNKEKELLLKVLCAMLPYGVKVNYADKTYDVLGYYGNNLIIVLPFMSNLESHPIETCKPYLRPMSSMTEEELNECVCRSGIKDIECPNWQDIPKEKQFVARLNHAIAVFLTDSNNVDWLNTHHFDYRGLIEKGLAIEAPEGMYN